MLAILILAASTSIWIPVVLTEQRARLNCTTTNTTTYISQVKLEGGPWLVNVEHCTTRICVGDNVDSIIDIITAPATKNIPTGYELFPGVGYYKLHPDAAIWARARQVCAEEGSHLLVINSEYEANVLKQLFTRFPKDKIRNYDGTLFEWSWVGVYEQGADGQYFTVLGQTLNMTGYSRWYPGEPNDKGTDDCMLAYAISAGYNDFPCVWKAPFICEFI